MINLNKKFAKFLIVSAVSATVVACGGGTDHVPDIDINITDHGSISGGSAGTGSTGGGNGSGNGSGTAAPDGFEAKLIQIIDDYGLPAAGGLLFQGTEMLEGAVSGKRSLDANAEVSMQDKWHMGSITKSMTATVAARLVEKGLIEWSTKVVDVFPDMRSQAQPALQDINLEQLLSHSAGLVRDFDWLSYEDSTLTDREIRMKVVADAMKSGLSGDVGNFSYSNLSYVVAGAMLEQVADKSWQVLMQEELFGPLEMSDAGFGAPTGGESQPSGHFNDNGNISAIPGELSYSDNPSLIGPAGTVHMSMGSLAKYAQAHMVGELGESDLLSARSFVKLHQEVEGTGYGLGWFIEQRGSIFHDGSNRLWFAKVGIDPAQQILAISVTNIGGDQANFATDLIINDMLQRHFN